MILKRQNRLIKFIDHLNINKLTSYEQSGLYTYSVSNNFSLSNGLDSSFEWKLSNNLFNNWSYLCIAYFFTISFKSDSLFIPTSSNLF